MSRPLCSTSQAALAAVIASAALSAAACADRTVGPLASRRPHTIGFFDCAANPDLDVCRSTCSDSIEACACPPGGTDPSCAPPAPPQPGAGGPAGDSTSPRLRIVAAQGPNPERSFTTRSGERTLTLAAEVKPAALAGMIAWTVVDDPADRVQSAAPSEAPPTGPSAAVDVPTQTTARWRLPHGTAWTDKALAFKVVAQAAGSSGSLRDSVVVRQREVDVLRQEYADFKIPVPGAQDVRTPGQVTGLTRFSWSDLNKGDYGAAVLTPVLLAKLSELDANAGGTLSLSSVFRNPAHHRYHISVSGGSATALLSQHQYGTAVDIRTFRDESRWGRLRNLAKAVGACAEPKNVSTTDHVHADWRTGAPNCPKGW